MAHGRLPIQLLGQSGCRLGFPGATVYLDPYLSNSVQELDAPDLVRLRPVDLLPEQVTDADWVLITHCHIDHCDPKTLPALASASPGARFVGPAPVLECLRTWGIAEMRLHLAPEEGLALSQHLSVRAIPAAHPEIARDENGQLQCVGYLLDFAGHLIYLAGDTSPRQEIIDILRSVGPVHTAFLPVNEDNYFRRRRGILGNMSVREAFQFAREIGVKQVVAVHWDMFDCNSADPEEIRLLHRRLDPGFALLINPKAISLEVIHVSIVIRTLNEAVHLEALLEGVRHQNSHGLNCEVVLVDSGSTDGTLQIAQHYDCHIHHIRREEFSFGRSLNIGCAAARGDILVIASGHCEPCDVDWLQRLCQPLLEGVADYSYGRQLGGPTSRFSEHRIFAKYFPEKSQIPQDGAFCNNANSALLRGAWETYLFDEDLTGLEDMELAQRVVRDGGRVAYVADAVVFHHHQETWPQVRRRFEREAIALQRILPQIHLGPLDFLRYVMSSIWLDWRAAWGVGQWRSKAAEIVAYRFNQYLGSFKGNHEHRRLSHAEKEKFFFPD